MEIIMKSLRMTNFLLMVIAVCLIYQCVKVGSQSASAKLEHLPPGLSAARAALAHKPGGPARPIQATQAVRIVGPVDVNVVDWQVIPDLDVNVTNTELPVSVENITPIDVSIDR
jgi:hypothetical protein